MTSIEYIYYYLSGKKKGKTASYFILDVIHTYKIYIERTVNE